MLWVCQLLFSTFLREGNVGIIHNFLSFLTGSLSAPIVSAKALPTPAPITFPQPLPPTLLSLGPLHPDLLHDAFLIIVSE